MLEKVDIAGLTRDEFVAIASSFKKGRGLASDCYAHFMKCGVLDPKRFGGGHEAQISYQEKFDTTPLVFVREIIELSNYEIPTHKLVLKLRDGLEVECVRIPRSKGRSTLCISSQVGCKLACAFCETGKLGILRNLNVSEIVGQLLFAIHNKGFKIDNLVFMGMGEPLDNRDAVFQALRVFTERYGLSFSQSKIGLCTSGIPDGIPALKMLGLEKLHLSVSLNAGTDATRLKIMPITKRLSLKELQSQLIDYRTKNNLVYGLNYCLLPGINDSLKEAEGVRDFVAPLGKVLINLIPYNPGSFPLTRAPTELEVETWITTLKSLGLAVARRVTRGQSVMAACGQLGNLELVELHKKNRLRNKLENIGLGAATSS